VICNQPAHYFFPPAHCKYARGGKKMKALEIIGKKEGKIESKTIAVQRADLLRTGK